MEQRWTNWDIFVISLLQFVEKSVMISQNVTNGQQELILLRTTFEQIC